MRTCTIFQLTCLMGMFILFPPGEGVCRVHGSSADSVQLRRAQTVFDAIYAKYSADHTSLLRENYPYDNTYQADYLAGEGSSSTNSYAYLWPFSGTLSAANALFEGTGDTAYLHWVDSRILPGLREYYDDSRQPAAYASYIRAKGHSDRFYDDNIWLGIDFAELYLHSGNRTYLDKATEIWAFIASGQDTLLGGGVYWCEQKKESKNACSNAPAAVFALRLFEATGDSVYFRQGEEWYEWTKKWLQDPDDGLYWDNVNLHGKIDKRKYPYNSGQMLQAAVLLHRVTGDPRYLADARQIARSGYHFFFEDFTDTDGKVRKLLKRSNNWFIAVMLRGYVELFGVDGNRTYLDAFAESLDYAWEHARSTEGLFSQEWKRVKPESRRWLLDQAAMAEMYARIGILQ